MRKGDEMRGCCANCTYEERCWIPIVMKEKRLASDEDKEAMADLNAAAIYSEYDFVCNRHVTKHEKPKTVYIITRF